MSLPFNEQASGYSVKSLVSKFAGAVLNFPSPARPSGPHHFIQYSVAQANVKCSKGDFSAVLFLMNFGDVSHQGSFWEDRTTMTEESPKTQVATSLLSGKKVKPARPLWSDPLYPCRSFIPELYGKALVPPDSRKQCAPKLFNSPWKQQQRRWSL